MVNLPRLERRFGIPGVISILAFIVWFIGWVAFGLHGHGFHFLVLLAGVFGAWQVVRRLHAHA